MAGARIRAGTGVELSVGGGGDSASRWSGISLPWPIWVPWSISLGKVALGSISWPEWPPELIIPWQVALGSVSVYCAGGQRITLVPFPLTPEASCPVVLGLVAGPAFCLRVHLFFCHFCVLWTLEEIIQA